MLCLAHAGRIGLAAISGAFGVEKLSGWQYVREHVAKVPCRVLRGRFTLCLLSGSGACSKRTSITRRMAEFVHVFTCPCIPSRRWPAVYPRRWPVSSDVSTKKKLTAAAALLPAALN